MNMPATDIPTDTTPARGLVPPSDQVSATAHTSLPTPAELRARFTVSAKLATRIADHRRAVTSVLNGEDDRLLVVVGPCSLHEEEAALDYGRRLARLAEETSDRLLLVMRAYVEKPRTTVGWKGLAYDPEHTGIGDLGLGLTRSRSLLLELAEMGLPLATEALNPLVMRYLEDLLSWAAIGARTAESQPHRELVSGLALPVGFKNATDGSVDAAVNSMQAAAQPHQGIGIDEQGQVAAVSSPGNPHTHLVLRGGRGLTNYDAASILAAQEKLRSKGGNPRVMVDCSHDNACKQHQMQPLIARDVLAQKVAGNRAIAGLMLESFLEGGRQDMGPTAAYGLSITDPCLGWEQTVATLHHLHEQMGLCKAESLALEQR